MEKLLESGVDPAGEARVFFFSLGNVLDDELDRIEGLEREVDDLGVGGTLARTDLAERVLHAVGDLAHHAVAHHGGGALQRMGRPEQLVEDVPVLRAFSMASRPFVRFWMWSSASIRKNSIKADLSNFPAIRAPWKGSGYRVRIMGETSA